MEEARKLVEQGRKYWDSLLESDESLRKVQDQALSLAKDTLKLTQLEVARMEAAATEQFTEAKTVVEKVLDEAQKYENEFFTTLKGGVLYAMEHRGQSALVGGTILLFALPATQRFIYRSTVGRFRTPEGLVQTAEQRLENLKQSLEVLRNDSVKLKERALAAEQEFTSGRSKLRATVAEVKRSWSIAHQAENKAGGLKELLKELPARDSVRLRSELASVRHELRQQAVTLDRQALRISRLGIDV